jgi:hypothetical protein
VNEDKSGMIRMGNTELKLTATSEMIEEKIRVRVS